MRRTAAYPDLAPSPLYVPLWSGRILHEMSRNLLKSGRLDQERADRLRGSTEEAFPQAEVPEDAIEALESSMTNDPGDRHVLAAAVAGRADAWQRRSGSRPTT